MAFHQAEVWLSSLISAMHRVVGAFILTFPILRILLTVHFVSLVASTTLTSFQWQEGGAQPSLYELLYRKLFPTV